ncbi:MAG: ribosomal protein S18-alanine N-acetyltransferase [Microbacterium sp.]|uniref:ribosomal protein S18-alanine N-acetyltransferase n=1 Tax=Microbacterium sp. TaxID=51671 RepID=UPI0039E5967F
MSMRSATADDLAAIMAIERACFPTDAWSEAMMAAELASPHTAYTVVEEGGRVIGYGGVRAVAGAGDADIQTIALDAAVRGRGRGRDLLANLLGHALVAGAGTVFLEVRADNPVAQSLYRSEGFIETGRRPRYYQPDDVDAVIMRLDLTGWASAIQAEPRERDAHAAVGDDLPELRARGSARPPAGRGWC